MTATATAIAEGDLSHRVPVAPAGTEAGQLGGALNTMLGRIEAAFDARAASEQRLRRFVADASHELRTPVTTIRGYAELYRQGGLDEREALDQAMRRTEQEAIRMGGLVDDLLLLARLDQGRPLDRAPVDLGVLAVDACSDAQLVAPDHRVVADVQPDVVVDGDEPRLRQVVHNLVRNAVVHTPRGTHVQVQVAVVAGRAVLEVRDDGPGMDPDAVAHAFERFWRADSSRARESGGSGLGLSIVHAIVHAHGGQVSLSSTRGAGTTVRVELPLAYTRTPSTPPSPARMG
jgi:two-component system OmpR family sensor kinase